MGLRESSPPLTPYVNSQPFRVGQGDLSQWYSKFLSLAFSVTPVEVLNLLQVPAELLLRGLHASPMLSKVRKTMGWQHSSEARGASSERPTGNQYTWAGFL